MTALKIQLISDVHTEFHMTDQGRKVCQNISACSKDVDVLCIAGDLSDFDHLKYPISIFADNYKDVVYVPGNHDYYKSSREKTHDLLREAMVKYPNFHWLDNEVKEIQGQRFVGSTLWFPDTPIARKMTYWMTDFQVIILFQDWIWDQFKKNREFLESNLQKGDVLITHHLPCNEAIHPRWIGHDANCFFVGDIEDIIKEKKPALSFFGHTHFAMQFKLHDTYFYCNPLGYPSEKNGFKYDLIINYDNSSVV